MVNGVPPRGPAPRLGSGLGSPYADLRETHSGVVLLLGDTALKLKKPVDLGFLDFTTLELREQACRREVRLNRRFAPDVYQGTVRLVDEDGRTLEHLVVMRRLPETARLATLVRAGRDVDEPLRAIARQLATLHAASEPVRGARTVTSDSLRGLWLSALEVVRQRPEVVAEATGRDVDRLAGRYLDGRGPLLAQRVAEGAVVDGHGDLIAEDVFCLPDGPRILDCLDFDESLRIVDRIDDAAFLAMDLERLGAASAGARFLDRYREYAADTAPDSLVDHYLAYRAFVRCKVACLRHSQGDHRAAGEAVRCAGVALAHLERARVVLVTVGGPPATGKSTLAAGLADRLGMVVLSSDRVRKELGGLDPAAPRPERLEEGVFAPAVTERVYGELLARAGELLRRGESVVVDATFARGSQRDAARRVADDAAGDLVELRCNLDFERARERTWVRGSALSAAGTVSDARPEVLRELWDAFEPWPAAHDVRTSRAPEEVVAAAQLLVRPPDARTVRSHLPRLEPG